MTTSPGARTPPLTIDWTRCDGHGLCAQLLPRSVVLDDWGYPIVDGAAVAGETETARARAVSLCPSLAMRRGPARRG